MRRSDFTEGFPGELIEIRSIRGELALAYIPAQLPPPIAFSSELATNIGEALLQLGQLNGMSFQLPNPERLLVPFINREAVASSRIEGTRTDFDDLTFHESSQYNTSKVDDLQEVVNYRNALRYGWYRDEPRNLSRGLTLELHHMLMTGVRGSRRIPGQFRSGEVQIGSARDTLATAKFVPPPGFEVQALIDDLFTYIDTQDDLPPIVRVALAHYQFETVHPFEDGNGRTGRLLIPLLMKQWGLLLTPSLYLSEFFERHRSDYIDLLHRVNTRGEWVEWIDFFVFGVATKAREAIALMQQLVLKRTELLEAYRDHRSANLIRIIEMLFASPVVSVPEVARRLGVTDRAARLLTYRLRDDGVLSEQSGPGSGKVYVAEEIMNLLRPTD